jgi:hypothetical protein
MPYCCTDDFLDRHVRVADAATGAEAVRAAALDDRRRFMGASNTPLTVLIIPPAQLSQLEAAAGDAARRGGGPLSMRVPWAVTWVGNGHYEVTRSAAGFEAGEWDGVISFFWRLSTDGESETVLHAVPPVGGTPAPVP